MDDDGSNDVRPRKQTTPAVKPSSLPKQKATVKELATDTIAVVSPAKSLIEPQIIERIRKCFAMASSSAGTTEAESQRALRIAHNLMSQYNVTQAEAIQCNDGTNYSQLGGKSVVAITSTKKSRNVIQEGFTNNLTAAICMFFNCKSYSCKFQTSVQWTFYGIPSNTAAAAMAFEMAYNLISSWAVLRDISIRNSYCLGLARGLYLIACEEKKEEEVRARNENRLPEITWASEMQLQLFRASAEKIAAEYLHAQGIKFSGPLRKAADPLNHAAYEQGKADSHKIDVRSVLKKRLE